jgi:disulfide bond formation protein DsbB
MLAKFEKFSMTERALLTGLITSAAMLAGAHAFEFFGGLAPCALCLDQREAHWAALGVAAAGLFVGIVFRSRFGAAAAVGAAALVYAVSAGLAFFHTGVEFQFWPGPASCSGGGPVNFDDLAGALNNKAAAPSCDAVQWRMFGVSMAGYNLLISAGLFALTAKAAIAETRLARIDRRHSREDHTVNE